MEMKTMTSITILRMAPVLLRRRAMVLSYVLRFLWPSDLVWVPKICNRSLLHNGHGTSVGSVVRGLCQMYGCRTTSPI